MASMQDVGQFVANPFGLGDAGAGAVDYLANSLGLDNNSKIDSAQGTLDQILARSGSVSAQNKGIYDDYYGKMLGMYGQGAGEYSDAVKNLADAIGNRGDFQYDKSAEDFLDPFRDQAAAQAMDALNRSASSGGNRFSSSYNDAMAAKQRALATESWKTAYDTMMRDRQQQLAEWQSGQQRINNLGTLAGIYQGDRDQLGQAIGDYYSAQANQNNADLETYSDVMQNKANLDTQRNSGVGALAGTVGSVIGAIF